jgi:septation ring formation regulator EzrA
MKKLLVIALVIGVCFYFVKKSSLFSYASTVWSQVKTETKNVVPTRFEIDRARHEIANLDDDIGNMIRPIAEYKAAILRVKKDIARSERALDDQKGVLLTMTKDLEGNPAVLVYAGEEYSAERVRGKLSKDFKSYKRLETKLQSQRKLLEAKEASLKATQEQLAKIIAKKREYEVRLAQLEADEETLQIARIGSTLQIDTSRTTQIEAALADIEHRQDVQRAEVELKTGTLANDVIPVQERKQSRQDVHAIRDYLEGQSTVQGQTTTTTARP